MTLKNTERDLRIPKDPRRPRVPKDTEGHRREPMNIEGYQRMPRDIPPTLGGKEEQEEGRSRPLTEFRGGEGPKIICMPNNFRSYPASSVASWVRWSTQRKNF